ncbi:transposase [Trichonephila inaurata madagascariensis]|uniref:Transposase n=1 Tax=Trichonephila inaurata madagascariensis TaxID=2747483 RepID=A0A8X6WSD9_9ARAC|nr:transposase [Trichonephila inaurata madagascariensis]
MNPEIASDKQSIVDVLCKDSYGNTYIAEMQLAKDKSFEKQDTTDEDLRKIAEKSPIIKLAYDELDKFHWNEKDLVACEERVMDLQKEAAIWEQRLDDATQKGIQIGHEKGRAEGRKEEKIEVAKNLLKAGVSINISYHK